MVLQPHSLGDGMGIKRIAVVVNPRGGRCNGIRVFDRIAPIFATADIELEITVTERAGHAFEIAANLDLNRLEAICVVGGDGTIHEVANGLMQRSETIKVPIGIIPAGTGNSIAQHLGFETPTDAAHRIVAGRTEPLDIIEVALKDRKIYCANIVGWGAVSDINATAERMRFMGVSRYSLSALWHIASPTIRKTTLVLDGKSQSDDFLFVMACNTRFTGAGMKLAPSAEIGDAKIDVVVMRRASRWQLLSLFRKVFDGSHVSMPCVEIHQVRSFSIHSEGSHSLNLDGEMKGTCPMSATVIPAALTIYA